MLHQFKESEFKQLQSNRGPLVTSPAQIVLIDAEDKGEFLMRLFIKSLRYSHVVI